MVTEDGAFLAGVWTIVAVAGQTQEHLANVVEQGCRDRAVDRATTVRSCSLTFGAITELVPRSECRLKIHGSAAVQASFAFSVYDYEEPTLSERFGAEYDAYRRAVPAWWPASACGIWIRSTDDVARALDHARVSSGGHAVSKDRVTDLNWGTGSLSGGGQL